MLPDQSILIGQNLTENAKMPNMKWDILGDFKQCAACVELFFVNQWAFFAIFSQYRKQQYIMRTKKGIQPHMFVVTLCVNNEVDWVPQ